MEKPHSHEQEIPLLQSGVEDDPDQIEAQKAPKGDANERKKPYGLIGAYVMDD